MAISIIALSKFINHLQKFMNKFLLTIAIAITFAFSANAQSESYVPFRVHISPFTYVIPNYTKGYGAGAGISIEPAYAINDNFVAGLKLEAALFGSGTETSSSIGAVGSYVLTGDYYLGEGKSRFFGGLGVGLFSGATASIYDNGSTTAEAAGGSGFGFVPRLGIQLSHFRLAAEYNLAPKNMSYLGIKAAITIGGGMY